MSPGAPLPEAARLGGLRARFPAVVAAGAPVSLDNAATTHRPEAVLAALDRFYRETNANVHRAAHRLGREATRGYEGARRKVAAFLACRPEEVVFTRNATEAINLVARGYVEPRLAPGDVLVVTALEHHSNLVPWQQLCRRTGASLAVLPVDAEGRLVLPIVLPERTRFLAATRVSNALGTLVPTERLLEAARARGIPVLLDVSQAMGHLPRDAGTERAEFLAFSAHKMYGPMGVGVLRGRAELLAEMEPVTFGGEMVDSVGPTEATWKPPPWRFEPGTPAAAEVSAFVPALDLLEEATLPAVREHEQALLERLLEGLARVEGLEVVGPRTAAERSGAVSFVVPGGDPLVVATVLDLQGIAVRAGWHCAEPLLRSLGRGPTVRASVALYSCAEDVDRLLQALPEAVAACR